MEGMGQQWKQMMPMEGFAFGRPRLGLSIQDTDDGVGVKVLDVDEESAAAKAGIKKDDIIIGVDDTDVKGTDDVVRTTRDRADKTSYKFKVKRGGSTQTIEVKIPRKLKTADL
jgi:serine protease Do